MRFSEGRAPPATGGGSGGEGGGTTAMGAVEGAGVGVGVGVGVGAFTAVSRGPLRTAASPAGSTVGLVLPLAPALGTGKAMPCPFSRA